WSSGAPPAAWGGWRSPASCASSSTSSARRPRRRMRRCAMGNVIVTPHPVTLEGQRRESLVPGETVRELLVRVAPEAPPEEWQVHVDGNPVRPEEYDHVR